MLTKKETNEVLINPMRNSVFTVHSEIMLMLLSINLSDKE